MKIPFVDLRSQYLALKPRITARIEEVLEHGQYIMGPEVGELEQRLATYTGAKHCITVASGTDALLISLMALEIGPGDEVITTSFTFVATAEVIAMLGAKPVFVDIDPETCNIDAKLVEKRITKKTKAIIPVSLYGQPADMEEINSIALRYGNIPVIEDAAQSFGATYRGKKSCNLSTFGCTSFFPSKPLGCYGDGGAIFTSDDRLAKVCREIRVHGQSERYVHSRIGVGGRMDTLQCAIVLAKLERFEWEVEQRHLIGQRYSDLILAELAHQTKAKQNHNKDEKFFTCLEDEIQTLCLRPNRSTVYAQYTIRTKNREAIQARLRESGIPSTVHYPFPVNEQPAYKKFCCPDCTPVASRIAKEVISLPMSSDLLMEDQEKIIRRLFSY